MSDSHRASFAKFKQLFVANCGKNRRADFALPSPRPLAIDGAMPSDFEQVAAACGLAVQDIAMTADEWAALERVAKQDGIGVEELLRRVIAERLVAEGEYDARVVELPRRPA